RRLADFYVTVFGCTVIPPIRNQSGTWLADGTGVPGARREGAHLLLPGHGPNGPTLEIFQYAQNEDLIPISPNTRGFSHIAFEVVSVEATLESIMEHGGQRLGTITRNDVSGVGQLTFVYARDPDGNVLEIQNWSAP
ncbi:MAG: VOC family protein, partial [Planctomycetota bacterium]